MSSRTQDFICCNTNAFSVSESAHRDIKLTDFKHRLFHEIQKVVKKGGW